MKSIKLILAITVLLSSGCRNSKVNPSGEEIIRVRVTEIAPEAFSLPVHSTGILVSSDEMRLSFKTGGIIAQIPVREGDRVKKGAILSSLNLSEINAQLNLVRTGYDKALRDFNRAKNLYADSVATLEQVQNATSALNAAKSNLDIVQFNLAHSKISAPEDGIILKQFVKANELISPGYPVFLFGTSGKNWKVKSSLSDMDIVRINPGDSVIVSFDPWPGITFPGAVEQVGGMSNPLTGTYEIEMALNKTDYRLAAGFIASVDLFPSKRESFITIPLGAVVEADGNGGYVYSVTDSMTVQKIKIEIVTVVGSKAAIKGDLKGIREIVSEGAAYLRDGARVEVVK